MDYTAISMQENCQHEKEGKPSDRQLNYHQVLNALRNAQITHPELERFRDEFLNVLKKRTNHPNYPLFRRAASGCFGTDIDYLEGYMRYMGRCRQRELDNLVLFVGQIINILELREIKKSGGRRK
jgi:hypothetical protein